MIVKDIAVIRDVFYTIGKDFAFEFLLKNSKATREEIIQALLVKPPKHLPPDIARQTAERITDRVLFVTIKSAN